MNIFTNFPFIISLLGVVIAQVLKVPIHLIATKKINLGLLISNGGMPSSHSAAVTALTTGIALERGMNSPIFAVSAMFAIITMFDAAGVRRQAGEQATIINQLTADFQMLIDEIKDWPQKETREREKKLKELLGHKPIEVFFGALTGIALALIVYFYLW